VSHPARPPRILDLTPPITGRLAVWPGDRPCRLERTAAHKAGDGVEIGALHATLHLGAHVDAPRHLLPGGATLDELPLELFVGRCQVLHVPAAPGSRVGLRDLPEGIRAPRVLLATGTWPDPETWREDFAGLAPELLEALHGQGVRLVGVDTPSVDPWGAALDAHRTAARLGMVILEGLRLEQAPAGVHTLLALPLALAGVEAAPVRALLLPGVPPWPDAALDETGPGARD